jgi:hypothetical protein
MAAVVTNIITLAVALAPDWLNTTVDIAAIAPATAVAPETDVTNVKSGNSTLDITVALDTDTAAAGLRRLGVTVAPV